MFIDFPRLTFPLLLSHISASVQSLSRYWTMGRIFLDHIGGTRLFSCANCDTILTNRSELISTRFTGATGRAFLFNKVQSMNVYFWCLVSWKQDTTIQGSVTSFIVCFACRRLNLAGGEPAVQRGAGQSDAHWTAHGEGRQLQELQQQTGLDLRICHRGQSAVQGGPSHPGEGAGAGERGLWGARPVRQLMSPCAGSTRPVPLLHPPSLPCLHAAHQHLQT